MHGNDLKRQRLLTKDSIYFHFYLWVINLLKDINEVIFPVTAYHWTGKWWTYLFPKYSSIHHSVFRKINNHIGKCPSPRLDSNISFFISFLFDCTAAKVSVQQQELVTPSVQLLSIHLTIVSKTYLLPCTQLGILVFWISLTFSPQCV